MLGLLSAVQTLYFATGAVATVLQGAPVAVTAVEDKLKSWSGSASNIPDGKMWVLPIDNEDASRGWLWNLTPNNEVTGSSTSINDLSSSPYGDNNDTQEDGSGADWVQIPPTIPIPASSETGLRGNGSNYDEGSVWIMNAFRLSEASTPEADTNSLIGFEHNEDYWSNTDCTHKSVGVRYSSDLGKSWTRSIPIVTEGVQTEACNESNKFTGTADMAVMWNPSKHEWVMFAQEGPLVMSTSQDPQAKPGTWTRIDPVSGKTAPGFIGDGTTTTHGDLISIGGSNPSIIRDQKNNVWHMVYAKWGGGIAYTKSADLYRWDKPYLLVNITDQIPQPQYPSLIGDKGDQLTTDGTATLLFGGDNKVSWGRDLWSVVIEFSGGATNATTASNATSGAAPEPGPPTASTGTDVPSTTAPVDEKVASSVTAAPAASDSTSALVNIVAPSSTSAPRKHKHHAFHRPHHPHHKKGDHKAT